ncbi:hypothetical protein ACNKHM_05475 [Shigella sonnei]
MRKARDEITCCRCITPGKPLEIVEIDIAPPKKGEVLIKVTIAVLPSDALPSPAMTRKVSSRWFSVTKGPGL